MARISLVHGCADDGAALKACHVLVDPCWRPAFSGNVTLKYALVECVSKGPGVSMEACVVARMNGGVSSSVGRTSDGMVDDVLRADEVDQAVEGVAETREQIDPAQDDRCPAPPAPRCGVLFGSIFLGQRVELRLVLVQVGVADLEQADRAA